MKKNWEGEIFIIGNGGFENKCVKKKISEKKKARDIWKKNQQEEERSILKGQKKIINGKNPFVCESAKWWNGEMVITLWWKCEKYVWNMCENIINGKKWKNKKREKREEREIYVWEKEEFCFFNKNNIFFFPSLSLFLKKKLKFNKKENMKLII